MHICVSLFIYPLVLYLFIHLPYLVRQIVVRTHPMGEMGHVVVHRPQCEQRVQAFWLVGSGSKAAATSTIALVMVDVVKIYDDTQADMF
jgi:hypothetical protein